MLYFINNVLLCCKRARKTPGRLAALPINGRHLRGASFPQHGGKRDCLLTPAHHISRLLNTAPGPVGSLAALKLKISWKSWQADSGLLSWWSRRHVGMWQHLWLHFQGRGLGDFTRIGSPSEQLKKPSWGGGGLKRWFPRMSPLHWGGLGFCSGCPQGIQGSEWNEQVLSLQASAVRGRTCASPPPVLTPLFVLP